MKKMITAAMLAAAAMASLLPRAALASDVPGDTSTRARLPITSGDRSLGKFEATKDSDWYRVRLVGGRDYYLSGYVQPPGSGGSALIALRMRSPSGQILAVSRDYPGEATGFEIRAPTSGTYFAEAKLIEGPAWSTYAIRVSPDCRGDTGTQCKIKPGDARQAITADGFEADWYSTSLSASRIYDARVQGGVTELAVYDDRGRIVSNPFYRDDPSSIGAFRPPSDGLYFLAVDSGGDDEGSRYVLTLSPGR